MPGQRTKAREDTGLSALFFFLLCVFSLPAAENIHSHDTIFELDKITVTATGTPRRAAQISSSVSLVPDVVLEQSPARNVDDIISTQTGVQMRRSVGIGEGVPADLILRAIPGCLAGTRTLVLVDGIPTNASGTPFLIINEIPLAAIRSVEIVRGPCSNLYGANAFSGVVNIITKTGEGRASGSLELESSWPFSLAYNDLVRNIPFNDAARKAFLETYWRADGTVSGSQGPFSILVSSGARRVGNYLFADSSLARKGNSTRNKTADNHDYSDQRIFVKSRFKVSGKTDLLCDVRFFNSSLGFGFADTNGENGPNPVTIEGTKFLLSPRIRTLLSDKATLRAGGYFRTLSGRYRNQEALSDTTVCPSFWKSNSDEWQAEVQTTVLLNSPHIAHILLGGIEVLRNGIVFGAKQNGNTNTPIPGALPSQSSIENFAALVQDELSFGSQLVVTAGSRIDHHSLFGIAISPKIGASLQLIPPLRFRTSLGRAFRAPTLSELSMPDLAAGSSMIIRANPHLKPEYVWTVDGGAEYQPLSMLSFSLGAFRNNMTSLVDKDVLTAESMDPLKPRVISHQNLTAAWSQGLECSLRFKPRPGFDFSANWTFQGSRNQKAAEVRREFTREKRYTPEDYKVPLDYIPRNMGGFSGSFSRTAGRVVLDASISESIVGDRWFQAWTATDMNRDVKSVVDAGGVSLYIDPPLVKLQRYFRTDATLGVHIRERVKVSLDCQNLFNARFEESDGTKAPGRFASIKTTLRF